MLTSVVKPLVMTIVQLWQLYPLIGIDGGASTTYLCVSSCLMNVFATPVAVSLEPIVKILKTTTS